MCGGVRAPGCAILVSYKPLAIKVPTSAVDGKRRCCAATRVSTRLRSAAATAEHSYTSLRGRRAPLRHRALEQIYKLTSSRLASLAPSHHQSMPTQGPTPPQGQRATGWWPMPCSLETCASPRSTSSRAADHHLMTTNHHTLISTGRRCPATLHNTSMISVLPKTQRTTVRPFSRQLI